MSSFGERLRIAFRNVKNAEIARKLGISESAVKNYIGGRVPDSDRLIQISDLTNCNLHWLITGAGSTFLHEDFEVAAAVRKYDDWRPVLEAWYQHEGGEVPEIGAVSFMAGWHSLNFEQKINAVIDLKGFIDLQKAGKK